MKLRGEMRDSLVGILITVLITTFTSIIYTITAVYHHLSPLIRYLSGIYHHLLPPLLPPHSIPAVPRF